MKIIVLWTVVQNGNFDLSMVQDEFQNRFQGKKIRFRRLKAKLKHTLEKHIARHKKTRMRSETHTENCSDCNSIFRLISKLLAQIASTFSGIYFSS